MPHLIFQSIHKCLLETDFGLSLFDLEYFSLTKKNMFLIMKFIYKKQLWLFEAKINLFANKLFIISKTPTCLINKWLKTWINEVYFNKHILNTNM